MQNKQNKKETETAKKKSSTKPQKKKTKTKYLPDDGRTIYSMDGLNDTGRKSDKEKVHLEKEEKRELIKAAFAVYGPVFLGVLICFTIGAIIVYFWLR